MDNETKNNKNLRNKKLKISNKKNNSNLDWYYNNKIKKRNDNSSKNNNYNKNNKNNKNTNNRYSRNNDIKNNIKGNKDNSLNNKFVVKNIQPSIEEDNLKLENNKENNFNVGIEIKKSFWDKLKVISKKNKQKKVLDAEIVEKEEIKKVKNNIWNKLNIFKKKKKSDKKDKKIYLNKDNLNKKDSFWKKINVFKKKKDNDVNKVDLDKTILVKKKNKKDKIDLDKTIIVKRDKKKEQKNKLKDNNIKNNVINNNIEYNKTLYGKKSLNLSNNAKKSRRKIYFKEALFISLVFSLLNIIVYLLIDDSLIINITNLEYINIIFTFIFSFIVLFIIAFIVDSIVTEISVKIKNKKQLKVGGSYRNRWFIKGEDKENIGIKKRK